VLSFDDHIPNADALIDAVDRYVQQHNIVVLDRRGDGSAKHKPYYLWVPASKTEVRRFKSKGCGMTGFPAVVVTRPF
jgi:hypothetical protein